MEGLALYLFKSTLCVVLFFGVYWCFLKDQTFFRFNRYFLIVGLICSIFLPFYTYTYELRLQVLASQDSAAIPQPLAIQENFLGYYALIGYGIIACFLLARQLLGLIKIKQVISRSNFRSIKDCKLVSTPEFKSSFSVFNYIFFDTSEELSDVEKKMILRHELAHVKQHHWADLLLAQLFCTLQWFNPLAWVYLKAIRQNHEFLADEAVLQHGNSLASYRAVLVNHYIGTRIFAISSSFYHYPQQRIKMLAKPASNWFHKMAVFIILPALAIFLWAFSEAEVVVQEPTRTHSQNKPNTASNKKQKAAVTSTTTKQKTASAAKQKTTSSLDKKKAITAKVIPAETPLPPTVTIEKEQELNVAIQEPTITASAPLIKRASKPLYFVDGVEIFYGINNINSENISSIEVLKGGKAIMTYGERAKNGVVLIQMKK